MPPSPRLPFPVAPPTRVTGQRESRARCRREPARCLAPSLTVDSCVLQSLAAPLLARLLVDCGPALSPTAASTFDHACAGLVACAERGPVSRAPTPRSSASTPEPPSGGPRAEPAIAAPTATAPGMAIDSATATPAESAGPAHEEAPVWRCLCAAPRISRFASSDTSSPTANRPTARGSSFTRRSTAPSAQDTGARWSPFPVVASPQPSSIGSTASSCAPASSECGATAPARARLTTAHGRSRCIGRATLARSSTRSRRPSATALPRGSRQWT